MDGGTGPRHPGGHPADDAGRRGPRLPDLRRGHRAIATRTNRRRAPGSGRLGGRAGENRARASEDRQWAEDAEAPGDKDPPELPLDVDEADAAEQRREVKLDEDDYR